MVLIYVYIFLVGCCVASFVNVVIWRVPQHISVVKGRSFCPQCHRQIAWYDLLPIGSYLILKGRCRYCHCVIPARDTYIEVVGGFIALFCFTQYDISFECILVFTILMTLLAISMIDIDTMTIPNGLLLFLCIPILGMLYLEPNYSVIQRILGFLSCSLPMFLLERMFTNCFGGGDIKLIAIVGFLLGWKRTLLAMLIAILLGGGYATHLLLRKKVQKGSFLAFGPYICIGVFLSMCYGNELIALYFSFFFCIVT